jgi:hypothetical protein
MTDFHINLDAVEQAVTGDAALADTWLRSELATNILVWAQLYMDEDEVLSGSSRDILDRYINHHVSPIMEMFYPELQAWAKYGPPECEDEASEDSPPEQLPLWPYSSRSSLVAPEIAKSIRAWALNGGADGSPPRMTEKELNSYSQRQLVDMYLNQHLIPTLRKVAPWIDHEVCRGDN